MPRSVIDAGQLSYHNTNPTATDDLTAGYDYGSEWVNVVEFKFFKCIDPTINAAVWHEIANVYQLNTIKDNNEDPSLFNPESMNNYALYNAVYNINKIASDGNFTFYNPGPLDPYIEIGETSYKVFASFIYRGTSFWIPSTLYLLASRSNSTGLSYLRVYDVTNSQIIIEHIFTDAVATIHIGTIVPSVLPTNTAVFEFQAKRSTRSAGKSQIRAVGLYPEGAGS